MSTKLTTSHSVIYHWCIGRLDIQMIRGTKGHRLFAFWLRWKPANETD